MSIQYPSLGPENVVVATEGGLTPMSLKIRVTKLENVSIDFNKYVDKLIRIAGNYSEFKS